MSIRDHIRILKPLTIKESVVTRVRSLTEAYDIFPKSEGEIDTIDIPHNKDNLKATFGRLGQVIQSSLDLRLISSRR